MHLDRLQWAAFRSPGTAEKANAHVFIVFPGVGKNDRGLRQGS
jgi:hypothetical protein